MRRESLIATSIARMTKDSKRKWKEIELLGCWGKRKWEAAAMGNPREELSKDWERAFSG